MKRSLGIWGATLALALASTAAAVADTTDAAKKEMVKCPVMNLEVEKSKAIAVKTKSGKTVYVCCKGCVEAAKQMK